ncbi:MAG: pilus assembly protein [Planctomycetaceae bacterium]|jgi:hypothetical protein|nr:pilus assembly protein [Planctomycetaceae bacterium]
MRHPCCVASVPKNRKPGVGLPRRWGAVSLEFALVFPVYIITVISVFTLGIRIYQTQRYAAMAKFLARKAIVHGSAAEKLGPWGPTTLTGSFGDGSVVGDLMASKYNAGHPMSIYYRLTWPDGGNSGISGNRVEVTISSSSLPDGTLSASTGGTSLTTNISSTVTMAIAH